MAVGMLFLFGKVGESHGKTPKIEVAKGKDGQEKNGSQVLLSGNFPRSFVRWGLVVGNQEGFFLSMEVGAKLSFPASWSALKENDSGQVCPTDDPPNLLLCVISPNSCCRFNKLRKWLIPFHAGVYGGIIFCQPGRPGNWNPVARSLQLKTFDGSMAITSSPSWCSRAEALSKHVHRSDYREGAKLRLRHFTRRKEVEAKEAMWRWLVVLDGV